VAGLKGKERKYGALFWTLLTFNAERLIKAVSHLKIKIPSKNMHEKPLNTLIIHSIY
jgi:hypothetical protein